ncbi:MAG: hypothetical protein ACYDC8_04490 [Gammaproteobacteria bacterium]
MEIQASASEKAARAHASDVDAMTRRACKTPKKRRDRAVSMQQQRRRDAACYKVIA